MERLAVIIERRQVGSQMNLSSGQREPVTRAYIIGHGQQLARKRLAEAEMHRIVPPERPQSRQRSRWLARKTGRAA